MTKSEQAFTTKFLKWAKYHWKYGSSLGEVKDARSRKSIPFKEFKMHQIFNLHVAEDSRFIYKFSDIAGFGTPCDFVIVERGKGMIVTHFGGKEFQIINWKDLARLIGNEKRKSLTLDQARSIAIEIGEVL